MKVSKDGKTFHDIEDKYNPDGTNASALTPDEIERGYQEYVDVIKSADPNLKFTIPSSELNEARKKGYITRQESEIESNAQKDTVKKISSDTQKRFDNRESGFASEDAFIQSALDSASIGSTDKLAVLGSKIGGALREVVPKSVADYANLGDGNLTMEQQKQYREDLRQANPGLDAAGTIVGSLVPGMGAAKLAGMATKAGSAANLAANTILGGVEGSARELNRQSDTGNYDIGEIGEQGLISGWLNLGGQVAAAGLTKGLSAAAGGVDSVVKKGLNVVYGKEIQPFLENPKLLKLAQEAPDQIAAELAKYDGLSERLRKEIKSGLIAKAAPRNAEYARLAQTTEDMLAASPPKQPAVANVAAEVVEDTPEMAARKALSAEEGTAIVDVPHVVNPVDAETQIAREFGDTKISPPIGGETQISQVDVPTKISPVPEPEFAMPDFDKTVANTPGIKGSAQFDQGEQIRSAFATAKESAIESPLLKQSNNYEMIIERLEKLRDPSDIKAMANALDPDKGTFKLLTPKDKRIMAAVRENYLNSLPGDVRASFDRASALYAAEKPQTDILRQKVMSKLGDKRVVDRDIIKKRLMAPEKQMNEHVREAVENIAPNAKAVYQEADAVKQRIMEQSAYKKQLDRLTSKVDPSAVGALRMATPLTAAPASFSTAVSMIKAYDFASKFGDATFAQLKYLYPQAVVAGQIVPRIANQFLRAKGLQPYPED